MSIASFVKSLKAGFVDPLKKGPAPTAGTAQPNAVSQFSVNASNPLLDTPEEVQAIYDRLYKFDNTLTKDAFNKYTTSNPQALLDVYERYKPQKFVGSKIKLNDGREATVSGLRNYTNSDGFFVDTDLGTFDTYGKNFVERGAIYNKDKSSILSLRGSHLDELEQGDVSFLNGLLYDDLPTLNNTGLGLSSDFYLFNDPTYNARDGIDFTDPKTIEDRAKNIIVGGLNLAKGDNGKLYYAGANQSGNSATAVYLRGDRANVNRPFTGKAAGPNFSWSYQDVTPGKSVLGKVFGGFGESVAGAVRGVVSNPLVQLGVSTLVPGGAGLVAAANLGGALGSGAPISKALENAVKSYAINAAAGAAGNAVGGQVTGNLSKLASGATQGAVAAGLAGQNIGTGLLAGAAAGGAGGLLGNEVSGALGGNLGNVLGAGAAKATTELLKGGDVLEGFAKGAAREGVKLVGTPSIDLPSFDLPKFDLPKFDIPQVSLPTIPLPSLPNVSLPKVELPQFNLPDLDIPKPQIGLPELPKVNLPSISAPKLPSFDPSALYGLLGSSVLMGGLLGQRQQQAQQPMAAPRQYGIDDFKIAPQFSQYAGNFDNYGERGAGDFRFYNAPVTGLLG